MKRIALSLSILTITANAVDNLEPLKKHLHPRDMRFPTYQRALELMEERNVKTIVETGCTRLQGRIAFTGDGGSTVILGSWARDHDAHVYTVDISQKNIENAQLLTEPIKSHITYTVLDSVAYLEQFDKQIDFLYLDSFDFEADNPVSSQEHHLKEIEVAYEKLSDNAIILIDDCALPHGGKGKLAIEFLLNKGWKIERKHYQVLLIKA